MDNSSPGVPVLGIGFPVEDVNVAFRHVDL